MLSQAQINSLVEAITSMSVSLDVLAKTAQSASQAAADQLAKMAQQLDAMEAATKPSGS